jgi:hypothetical protein
MPLNDITAAIGLLAASLELVVVSGRVLCHTRALRPQTSRVRTWGQPPVRKGRGGSRRAR